MVVADPAPRVRLLGTDLGNETGRNCRDDVRRNVMARTGNCSRPARLRLARRPETRTGETSQKSRIRILSSLPAKTRPEGFAPDGCHAAREHGSTCQLSALPHGAAARTTVCMFGSLKPSDRSSGLRSFGLSEADHSGSLSGSRPMQQRLVCVEAGQTFSIQRMEVYAAGQQHSLPPHTRKDTGSIPVGTTHRLSAPAAGSAIRPSRRAPYR
jgi:hypothetical protein